MVLEIKDEKHRNWMFMIALFASKHHINFVDRGQIVLVFYSFGSYKVEKWKQNKTI